MRPASIECQKMSCLLLYLYISWNSGVYKSCYLNNSQVQLDRVPDAVENEEELDENAAKGQDATHDDAWNGFGKKGLHWDLPWDLVCPYWHFNHLWGEKGGEKNTKTQFK